MLLAPTPSPTSHLPLPSIQQLFSFSTLPGPASRSGQKTSAIIGLSFRTEVCLFFFFGWGVFIDYSYLLRSINLYYNEDDGRVEEIDQEESDQITIALVCFFFFFFSSTSTYLFFLLRFS